MIACHCRKVVSCWKKNLSKKISGAIGEFDSFDKISKNLVCRMLCRSKISKHKIDESTDSPGSLPFVFPVLCMKAISPVHSLVV